MLIFALNEHDISRQPSQPEGRCLKFKQMGNPGMHGKYRQKRKNQKTPVKLNFSPKRVMILATCVA